MGRADDFPKKARREKEGDRYSRMLRTNLTVEEEDLEEMESCKNLMSFLMMSEKWSSRANSFLRSSGKSLLIETRFSERNFFSFSISFHKHKKPKRGENLLGKGEAGGRKKKGNFSRGFPGNSGLGAGAGDFLVGVRGIDLLAAQAQVRVQEERKRIGGFAEKRRQGRGEL